MDTAHDGGPDAVDELSSLYERLKEEEMHAKLLQYKNKSMGATALHLAALNGHAEIVKFIVDCIKEDFSDERANMVNKVNKFQFTPLMCACSRGYLSKNQANVQENRLKIVKCLVDAGASVNYYTQDTLMTAAHWASYKKDDKVVEFLLENGAPHFHFSHMERLPIDVAGSSRAYKVVDVYLEKYLESQIPEATNMAGTAQEEIKR